MYRLTIILAVMKFFKNKVADNMSVKMQDAIIKMAEERLGKKLSAELKAKVRQPKWSYMGLEMIINTVRTIEDTEIENYLARLD